MERSSEKKRNSNHTTLKGRPTSGKIIHVYIVKGLAIKEGKTMGGEFGELRR